MNVEIFDALLAQVAQDEGGAKFSNWELIARKAIEEIERLQAGMAAASSHSGQLSALFDLAILERDAAKKELKTLRDWRTPKYSAAQQADFDAQGYTPPSQFIRWRYLPEVPEIPEGLPFVQVYVAHANEPVGEYCEVGRYNAGGEWLCDEYAVNVRAWHYLEEKAPPKPEGELPEVNFESEPKKCQHTEHSWLGDDGETATCCGCGELMVVGEVKNGR